MRIQAWLAALVLIVSGSVDARPRPGTPLEDLQGSVLDCAVDFGTEQKSCVVDDGHHLYRVSIKNERVARTRRIGPSWERLEAAISKAGPAPRKPGDDRFPAMFTKVDVSKCSPLYMSGLNPPDWKSCSTYQVWREHVMMRTAVLPLTAAECRSAIASFRRTPGSEYEPGVGKRIARTTVTKKHAGFMYKQSIGLGRSGCLLYERTMLWEALEHQLERSRKSRLKRTFNLGRK